ncbi:ATP-binding protein [Vibrio metschnikovii]|uniref:ATP-dependent nuclease n=1 Tax=Vibrio metschnikovii TaxID=28172 RepID=UPI002FCB387B
MKIRHLEINNFKGIKSLSWNLPKTSTIALIGKGDSSKTTILEAVRSVFYPHWSLQLADADFHNAQIDEPIIIRATIGALPEEFLNIGKYGLHLRGWNREQSSLQDEPQQYEVGGVMVDDEPVITVELKVGSDLEPHWNVITARNPDGIGFSLSDRKRLNATFIGAYNNKQLSWDAHSPLSKLTDETNLQSCLAKVTRAAKASFEANRDELKPLDEAANKVHALAKKLGVQSGEIYRSHLDVNAVNVKTGGIALHDGEIPIRQLGLGSRRMLACGIQTENLENQHITLIDEIEHGLEPHRISRLLKHIKEDTKGTYLFTTHNPTVLRELDFSELNVIHNEAGQVVVRNAAEKSAGAFKIQGTLRAHADSFLCPKVIVCEGSTEVGFIRGLDDYYVSQQRESLSYFGVSYLNASGGSEVQGRAEAMHALGYKVAVFVDSDAPKQFSDNDRDQLKKIGINVVMWEGGVALEQRLFMDLPWPLVVEFLTYAIEELAVDVIQNVSSKYGAPVPPMISDWNDTQKYREAIGSAAKSSGWFKNIALGEELGRKVTECFVEGDLDGTDTHNKLLMLRGFVEK